MWRFGYEYVEIFQKGEKNFKKPPYKMPIFSNKWEVFLIEKNYLKKFCKVPWTKYLNFSNK